MSTFKRVLKLIKPYFAYVCLSFTASFGTVLFQLVAPILAGNAIDYIIAAGRVDISGVKDTLIKLVFAIAVAMITQWFMSVLNNKIIYKIVEDLRIKIYKHVEKLPISFIDSHEYGDIVSRVLSDVDQLADGLLMGFTQLFTGVITIVGTLIFMFRVNVMVALVVVVLTPVSLLVAGFITKKTFNMFKKQSQERARMSSLINEMVGNEKTVQAFSYEKRAAERFDEINEDLVDAEFKATFFSSLTNPSTRLVNNIVYAGVGLVGALGVIRGLLSVGNLTVFLSYATQFAKPFNEISGVMTELSSAMASASRVFELLDTETLSSDADKAELVDVDGKVELDAVSFSYVPDKKLIENLSLYVEPGKRVAIVGPTGSGKSTIINLLMRFYDVDKGTITVDGKDIKEITRGSLRTNYGMVLQETWLKTGTIRENIAYGCPDATDEQIQEAARLTHADRFIRRLPDGYDTYISEEGGNLSAGQKQLLCITRVMLNLPPMLILDEATSSIDTRTEQRIQRSFNKMMQGRTTFVVAHRLSTIKESDVILVMKDGAVIEQGSHEELLEAGGFYHELYNSQLLLFSN
ncbi:MAG: ABC transporter ATP-binding protein/permease [Eubacterium sp.]|nr:ABC transporter ATP-binding protein/permease [Eubacterium sp.]